MSILAIYRALRTIALNEFVEYELRQERQRV